MGSFRSVTVGTFRGLRDADVDSLGAVNLVTGLNGSGKSSLLEAMFMLSAPDKPELSLAVLGFRSLGRFSAPESDLSRTPWESLFAIDSPIREVRLSAVEASGLAISIEMTTTEGVAKRSPTETRRTGRRDVVPQLDSNRVRGLRWVTRRGTRQVARTITATGGDPPMSVEPPSRGPQYQAAIHLASVHIQPESLAERFGRIELDGRTDELVESLSRFDRRVRAVRTIFSASGPFLHVDIGYGKLLPITLMGGGFVSFTEMLVNVYECQGGILLVDEIDSGFHYSMMERVWEVIGETAKAENTQIVGTTHSLEFIQHALNATRHSRGPDFTLYRLDRDEEAGRSVVVAYNSSEVESALELGIDVR